MNRGLGHLVDPALQEVLLVDQGGDHAGTLAWRVEWLEGPMPLTAELRDPGRGFAVLSVCRLEPFDTQAMTT